MKRAEIPVVAVTVETGNDETSLLGKVGFSALARRLFELHNTTATTLFAGEPSAVLYEGALPVIIVPDGLGAKATSEVDF